jgi:hypothetical protein
MPGYVMYQGPSLFDGEDIVVIATTSSRNVKTQNMVQTWILRRNVRPDHAVKLGLDSTICGTCPYRGGNGCYVLVWNAPLSVWNAFHRGSYEDISGDLDAIARVGAGMRVRLGAYGDPVAAPIDIWQALVSQSTGHTGYTHTWRVAPKGFRAMLMASADNSDGAARAQLLGWRTFRLNLDGTREKGEMTCPASKEAGMRTSCSECRACDGQRREGLSSKNVTIKLHGATAKRARAAILNLGAE